jgi:hypothetical protein
MKVKPWQIALIVIGMLVGVGSAVYTLLGSGGPELANSILLVDVETGQLYRADVHNKAVMLPARRPGDGKVALLRVRKDESGKYYVGERDLRLIEHLDKGVEVKAVMTDSGDVPQPSKDVKKYEPPSE